MYNKLDTKASNVENNIFDMITLLKQSISTDKQNSEKKVRDFDKNTLKISRLMNTTVLIQKLGTLGRKYQILVV